MSVALYATNQFWHHYLFLKAVAARIDDIEVVHWDNKRWGEIPADFGNK